MSLRFRILIGLLVLGFLVFLGLIIFFADTGAMPRAIRRLYAFPYGDKVGHFVLMGLLALSLNLALSARRIRIGGRNILLGSVLAFLLVTLEELTQVLFHTRTVSLIDLSFSYLGILCASLLIDSIQSRRQSANGASPMANSTENPPAPT